VTGRRATGLGSRAARPPRRALDVLAVGAHPDDVELGCGATLALLAAAGRAVGIVHLTSGEAGSRGTAEVRRREAATAARALGVAKLEILDCGDAGLRTGRAEEDALIEVLRRLRPRLVLGPPPSDRHPDHGRAHTLLRDACFYAGLAKRSPERGAPHRPAAFYCYLQHDLAVPTFVVDVTSSWARKTAALDAYASQLWPAGALSAGAASAARASASTFVSSPEFRQSIEARARHLGVGIGATYGEGFLALGPLAVADPLDLVPGGVR
jgi:bacillithiol biosynthesis deacetylase BshB1